MMAELQIWKRDTVRAFHSITVFAVFVLLQMGCSKRESHNTTSSPFQSSIFSHVEIVGTRGTGAGQFNKPRSLTLDTNDNLFVVASFVALSLTGVSPALASHVEGHAAILAGLMGIAYTLGGIMKGHHGEENGHSRFPATNGDG